MKEPAPIIIDSITFVRSDQQHCGRMTSTIAQHKGQTMEPGVYGPMKGVWVVNEKGKWFVPESAISEVKVG